MGKNGVMFLNFLPVFFRRISMINILFWINKSTTIDARVGCAAEKILAPVTNATRFSTKNKRLTQDAIEEESSSLSDKKQKKEKKKRNKSEWEKESEWD